MRERRDIGPVLLKFGVAVVLSLGGILYTILRNKRSKSSKRPPLLPPSTGGEQGKPKYEDHSLQTTPRSRLDQSSQTAPSSRLEQSLQTTPRARVSGSMAPESQSLQTTPRARVSGSMAPESQSLQTTPRARASGSMARESQSLQTTPRARASGSIAPETQSLQTTPRAHASGSMAPEIQTLQTTPRARTFGSMAPEKLEDISVTEGVTDICGPSTSGRSEGKDDGLLLPEFNDLVRDFNLGTSKPGFSPRKDVDLQYEAASAREYKSFEKDEHEQEIRSLKDIIKSLKERERTLEIKLLEYYGLKEQETVVMELQNRIKINNMEAKLFTLKIESLKADKKRLEAQVADYAKVVSELEAAKIKIKQLKKKLRSEVEHSKEQICALQERVMMMHDEEKKALETLHHQEKKAIETESDAHTKLQRIEDLQLEAEELRNSNNSLKIENSELAQRLEYVQILANSVLDDEVTEALKAESERLRKQNEDMAKEIEQLQADRCSDAEELVYLRWVNACLRYELRNYQPDPGKTIARDLSKTLSPKSEEKAKQLILEYAHKEGSGDKMTNSNDFDSDWSSSQASYLTDSGEPDDTSVDNSSAAQKANTSRKRKVFSKLMRLIRGKDHSRKHSHDRAPSAEDNSRKYHGDSPASNSGISPVVDAGHDSFNSRSRTSSQGSSRHSFHGTRPSSYQEGIRKSDASPAGLRRTDSTPASLNNSPQENFHKLDLMKYAEALKETRPIPSFRRRSASFSSLALS